MSRIPRKEPQQPGKHPCPYCWRSFATATSLSAHVGLWHALGSYADVQNRQLQHIRMPKR